METRKAKFRQQEKTEIFEKFSAKKKLKYGIFAF